MQQGRLSHMWKPQELIFEMVHFSDACSVNKPCETNVLAHRAGKAQNTLQHAGLQMTCMLSMHNTGAMIDCTSQRKCRQC